MLAIIVILISYTNCKKAEKSVLKVVKFPTNCRKFTNNKFTYFKPIRSCSRYDLTTGTALPPCSENGVIDFMESPLTTMHSIK